ncbi:hypothetical protein [Bradyrhizobium sp. SZCCHNRI2007]|uniref:hypothetical protein n=1 Tax=Bradyrhizobium sp. SZCCHNRI2007 TaxID=3057281 RepID=UPI0028F05C18|nr:hypothetical protein [Bradyrhizobium sp. SZCCHNRI2007]
MADILGPASAPNATTLRPSEGRNFAALDTWFKDCSSADADDGTDIQANWLNGVIAGLRAVWRGNGVKADGVTPVVAENGTDDYGLLTSVSHLIQRGQPHYGEDTSSTAGVLTATLSPAPAEYKKGMTVAIRAASTCGAGATLNLNGLGAIGIVRPDGSALHDGDIFAGSLNDYRFDGVHFQLLGADAPPIIKRNLTYYVAPAPLGSDANDGTSANASGGHGPFATLQAVVNAVANVNLNGYSITAYVADGTYPVVRLLPTAGSGSVAFISTSGNPSACVIAGVNQSAIQAAYCGSAYSFQGFKVTASGASYGDPIAGVNILGGNAYVVLTNMEYGACVGAHIMCSGSGQVLRLGTQTISGGCSGNLWAQGCHLLANSGALINTQGSALPTLSITAPVVFAGAFAMAQDLAECVAVFASITGAANVTGQKFVANMNGVIFTAASGDSYLPGSIAGVRANGGIYI